MIALMLSLTGIASAQAAVVLSAARATGADNYTIELRGSNFGSSGYVDVRFASSGDIMAQYIGAPPLTRWTSGGQDYLSFVVTDATQRNQLNSGGLFFWVVDPATGTFDGPKQVVRVPPSNQAPSVTITSPAANATFASPANITINADASDPDGNGIARVDFYNGTTLLGQDTSAPYAYTWSNVAAGGYTLRAIAIDGAGLASTASTVSVSVAATAGVILSSATATGADNYTIELRGNNFGTNAYVDVRYASSGNIMAQYIGTPPLTRGTSGGQDVLSFAVTDQAQRNQLNGGGLFFWVVNPTTNTFDGPKQVVRVPPPNLAPTVTITAPVANTTFNAPANITISANASDPDGNGIQRVDFYNGTTLIGQDTAAPYAYTWSSVGAGGYTLRAIAIDGLGLASTPSTVTVSVTASTSVVLSSATATGSDNYTIQLQGSNFGANAYVDVRYAASGNIMAQYIGSPPLTRWSSGGQDFLSFVVTDQAQRNQLNGGGLFFWVVNPTTNTFDGPKQVMRVPPPNLAPSVSITAPAANTTYNAPASITITANASDPDGTVQRVDFYNGNTLLGQDTTAPYAYTWSNVAIGSYTLRAIAYDAQGAASTPATVAVSVAQPPFQPILARGGSNFIWYQVGPRAQDCPREDWAIVNDYHRTEAFGGAKNVRNLVKGQLAQMYQAGQRSITISLYLSDGPIPNYGTIDSSGVQTATIQSFLPSLPAQYLANIRNFTLDAAAAGMEHVSIRYLWSGSNAPWMWEGAYQSTAAAGWQAAIADVRGVLANVGVTVDHDLGAELMPAPAPTNPSNPLYTRFRNWNRWASELWSWYVGNYGTADTVGFSFPTGVPVGSTLEGAKADLEGRLRNTAAIYGANYPAALDIHFYEEPTALFNKADDIMDELGKPNLPFKVGETFYDDANVALSLKQAAIARQRPIARIVQWPLTGPQRADTNTPNCDHVTLVPLSYSSYLSQGF